MILREMREHLRLAEPFSTTFVGGKAEKKRVEADLRARFENWAASWIEPLISELEEKEEQS